MEFTTAQIVTIGTGKLVCRIDDVYAILNFMTGDKLFTHQLPRAMRACEPALKTQFPWLDELDPTTCDVDTWKSWLTDAEQRFGANHDVAALPQNDWQGMDPIDELASMVDPAKIVQVTI